MRSHCSAALVAAVFTSTLAPYTMVAQQASANASSSASASSRRIAEPLPGIPEVAGDTGRVAHGWHDFTNYQWMGAGRMCEQAVLQAAQRVWRHGERDTASYAARMRETTPPAVRAIAERCGAPDLAQGVAAVARGAGHATFYSFFNLALALNATTEARALLRTHVAHVEEPEAQAKVLQTVVFTVMSEAHPPQLALIEDAVTILDSLVKRPGTPLSLWWVRLMARQQVWEHWMRMGDTARMRGAIEDQFLSMKAIPEGVSFGSNNHTDLAWGALLKLAILQHRVRSREVVDVLQRMNRESGDQLLGAREVPLLKWYDKPFEYPETEFWYTANGTPGAVNTVRDGAGSNVSGAKSPTVTPVPAGKVTLVWAADWTVDHTCGERCYSLWGMLRKLLDTYEKQGMQLVILAHTRGFASGTNTVSPEQEASVIRQFYQDKLGLKAIISIETTPFTHKYDPDLRRVNALTPWERRHMYPGVPLVGGIPGPTYTPPSPWLLDRHGNVRTIGFISGSSGADMTDDPILEMFIRQLLQEQ